MLTHNAKGRKKRPCTEPAREPGDRDGKGRAARATFAIVELRGGWMLGYAVTRDGDQHLVKARFKGRPRQRMTRLLLQLTGQNPREAGAFEALRAYAQCVAPVTLINEIGG